MISDDLSTDAGGLIISKPKSVVSPQSTEELSQILAKCSRDGQPMTVRGGGKTTEGESLANAEEQLIHLRSLNRVLSIDEAEGQKSVWVEGGTTVEEVDQVLAKHDLALPAVPLNLTATVGGTLGVGGIDVTSAFEGCLADQVVEVEVALPNGEVKRCSEELNRDLFEDVLYGYGQFGVVSRARLKTKKRSPIRLEFLYYTNIKIAISDLIELAQNKLCDQIAILSLRDDVIALIAGFESDPKFEEFQKRKRSFSGKSEWGLWLSKALDGFVDPTLISRLPFLFKSRRAIFRDFYHSDYWSGHYCHNRLAVFGRLIWNFWGHKPIVIPDISTTLNHLPALVEEGNAICQKYFSKYTLYIILVKKLASAPRYTLGPFPKTQGTLVGGVEFEPLLHLESPHSFETIQRFKEDIYSLAYKYQGRAYRFGGLMKHHVKGLCGEDEWNRFLEKKKKWDPQGLLNPRVLL